eukprot:Partr_v1_DN23559_c0_g1_i4_m14327 putative mitochondrial import inner membrane translocase, subunit
MDPNEQATINMINTVTESCPFKGVMSTGVGFLAGGAFGVVMSSFEISSLSPSYLDDSKPPPSLRVQMREALKDTGRRSFSMAKNFAVVGGVFATTECCIETYRAKHDIYNSASAGCISGAVLAAKGGPGAAAFGCASFAAFSSAIDYFMEGS